MKFSKEFFIQRSFEVVWAVFRVSEYVSRKKLKEALEDTAVEYLVYKNKSSLFSLEEVIRLAIQIKEITEPNGKVLLREVDNLKEILDKVYDGEAYNLFARKLPENAPNVEDVFGEATMLLPDFMEMLNTLPESGKKSEKSDEINEKDIVNTEKSEENKKNVKSVASGKVWQGLAKSGNAKSLAKSGNVARNTEKSSENANRDAILSTSSSARERRERILNIVKARNLCHIKDIVTEFPKTSPRTIRHDIKQMVDKGVLERIGSGGPNSFFRVKR